MSAKKVTYYMPLNFSVLYRSSIFRDNKLSPNARAVMTPLWDGEDRMRLEVVNRINTLLYDRREPLEFRFKRTLRILVDHKPHEVIGVRCDAAGPCNPALRILKIILEKDGMRTERDVMSVCGLSDCVRLMECVARRLYPRDDRPDDTPEQ